MNNKLWLMRKLYVHTNQYKLRVLEGLSGNGTAPTLHSRQYKPNFITIFVFKHVINLRKDSSK